jgi:hypothetical protein
VLPLLLLLQLQILIAHVAAAAAAAHQNILCIDHPGQEVLSPQMTCGTEALLHSPQLEVQSYHQQILNQQALLLLLPPWTLQ